MKNLLIGLSLFLSLVALFAARTALVTEPTAGAALPSATASFETSLQSGITSSATMMTLTANSVRGGGSLSGYNCFIVDEGSAQAETICGTVSGTTVSSLTRGISQATGTTTVAALQFAHRRGANVKISDFPIVQILKAIINAEDTIPNLLTYANTVLMTGSSPSTTVATKYYVDNVVTAGAADSSETVRGVVELATAAEAAAGTSLGATGARLVTPASIFSSSCSGTIIPVTTSGKISQGCIDLTQAFSFSGGVSSTGTTTVSASSLTTNPFVINTLAYKWPTSRGASSTVLTEDGNGNLAFYNAPIRILYNNGADLLSTSNTSTTTVATYVIPASTLTTRTALRISSMWTGNDPTQCYNQIDFGNGTATTTIAVLVAANAGRVGHIEAMIYASSTSGVYGHSTTHTPQAAGNQVAGTVYPGYFYSNANTTGLMYIDFRVRAAGAGVCTLVGRTIELISS